MSWRLDAAISEADGIDRWEEVIHGADARLMFNARHLVAVLAARPGYLLTKPKLRYTQPTLRLVKPAKEKTA